MNYQCLKVTRRGNIAVVVLNRPDKLNALNTDLMLDLERVAGEFSGDAETRVIVFTGAGKYFSAGADLEDSARRAQDHATLGIRRRIFKLGSRVIRALFDIEQITIAAINGGALGGGACIASALDFRIAAEGSFVSYPEIHLGMNLSWGALPLCVHLVGPSRAKRMVILGEKEPAATLKEWGFVDEVVPADKLVARAVEVAELYAKRPPVQAQMIKRSVNMISSALDQSIMHMDTDQFLLALSSKDHAEGVKAFFEKREPKFKGN